MAFVDHKDREIHCKLVYYGPGLGGKTTNLQYVYTKTRPEVKGRMISHATETERMLFFSFTPLSLGDIRGYRPRFHMYTVPGPVFYDASRKLVLKDADGVVFVADSQAERFEANVESLESLESNLALHGLAPAEVPLVLQYNKRDLPGALPVAELDKGLNAREVPALEAVATTGVGVFDTLKAIARLVLEVERAKG